MHIYFFKQKTAYEISTGLEFRRVLFRSRLRRVHHRAVANRRDDRAARVRELHAEGGAHPPPERPGLAAEEVRARAEGQMTQHVRQRRGRRSEERRVGKEDRSMREPG